MPAHKHCDLIKAWADGATIQIQCYDQSWQICPFPTWHIEYKYRIKPESKKIQYRFFLTKQGVIRCWTSSWMSSETNLEKNLTFKEWLSEKLVKEFDV